MTEEGEITVGRLAAAILLLVLTLLCVGTLFFTPSRADVRKLRIRACNAQQTHDIREANSFLRQIKNVLVNDFEFEGRLPREDVRVRRRMSRLIDDMRITCNRPFRCRGSDFFGTGFAIGPRIYICYDNIVDAIASGTVAPWDGFCTLADTLAHEFAHWIGMTAKAGHNKPNAFDPVIRFGFFVHDLCQQAGIHESIPLPMGATITVPISTCPTTQTAGALVFPRRQFNGCARHFLPVETNSDLRKIGRDKSISSIQTVGGPWEACIGRNFQNWCQVLNGNISDLRRLGFNNKIESLRPFHGFTGLVVFQGKNGTGGHHVFTQSVDNLKGTGFNDKISSLQVFSGTWRVCKDPGFQHCQSVSGVINDLGTGMNNKISSVQRM
jgi:hypothetical protein